MFVTVTYFWRLRLFSPVADNVSKSCLTITVTSPELRVFFRLLSFLLVSLSRHENFTDFGQSVWESLLRKTCAGFCVTNTWLEGSGKSLKLSLFTLLVPPLFLSSLVHLLWSKSVWKSFGVFLSTPDDFFSFVSPSSASLLALSRSLLSCSRPRTLEAISSLCLRRLALTTNVYIGHWLIRKISDDKQLSNVFPGICSISLCQRIWKINSFSNKSQVSGKSR